VRVSMTRMTSKTRRVVRLLTASAPWWGGVATMTVAWLLRADARVFRSAEPGASAAIFSGMLTFSALLASVLLALLAILASLDGRPIVQAIREARLYRALVHSALQPLISFIVLAATSFLALLMTSDDSGRFRKVVVTFAFGTTTFGILSTALFAWMLVRVMIDPKGDKSSWDPKDTPAGAEERGARDLPPRTRSDQHLS
jgi:hypothetical protein